MRTLTAAERNIISASAGAWCFAYMELKRFDGTWINIGALSTGTSTIDLFSSCTISDTIDDNTLSMTAVFQRESGIFSLSPFRTDSTLNDKGDGTYSPLVDLHREWRIKVAVVARGTTPTMGTTAFREMAAGRVDRIDIAGDPATVTIQGRGLEADLIDAWIPVKTRTYGSNALTINLGDALQAMLNDQGFKDVALSFDPSSPSWAPALWSQDEGHLFSAMADVAALPGANIRYKYDASDVNKLTLFTPPRTASVADWQIQDTEYEKLDVALDISGVRNYIPVKYVNATTGTQTVISPGAQAGTITAVAGAATFSTSQATTIVSGAIIVVAGVGYTVSAFNGTTGCTLSGAPTFTAATWYTSASITRYGLRTMPIDLSAQSQVVTSGSAGNLADAIRSDLESPALEQQIVGTGLWFVQLNDYVKLVANGVHYNEDQYGGVTSYQHTFSNGVLKTTIGLRGKPAGRYRTWLSVGADTAASSVGPVIDSVALSFYEENVVGPGLPAGVMVTFVMGADCLSAAMEISTDPLFASLSFSLPSAYLVDRATIGPLLRITFGFATAALRDLVYYARVTPYSGPLIPPGGPTYAPSGVAGTPVQATGYANRKPTDSATLTWDLTTSGQLKANVAGGVGGIGGSGSYTIFDPDAPFASPSTYDDEFSTSSIDAKWTQVNTALAGVAANTTTVTGQLLITKTTNSTPRVVLLQSIPAADFTAFLKMDHTDTSGDFWTAGFWLSDGTTAGAGNQYGLVQGYSANRLVGVFRETNFTTFAATVANTNRTDPLYNYLRLSRSGTTLYLDYSYSGLTWLNLTSWVSVFGITKFGIGYQHERGNANDELFFNFFRVVTGTAFARLGAARVIVTA